MNYLKEIKKQKPLIHNITNVVVANFSANGLLALGASPVMANAPEETAEIVAHANALVLNIGTCNREQIKSMILAGKAANQKGIPVILDPVAIGATNFRKSAVKKILSEIDVSVIRGNAGEIITFLGETTAVVKGADSMANGIDPDVAIRVANKYGAVVIATGETDIITDGESYTECYNGVSMLQYVTGTGCLLTAVVGAFSSVGVNRYVASVEAVSSYGVAAELAYKNCAGPGSFLPAFLDELYGLTEEKVKAKAITQNFTLEGKKNDVR